MADATPTDLPRHEEARVGSGTVPTTLEGDLPDGLSAAFDAYERALAADDQAALAAAFEPTATVMRADAGGLLVGHDAITAFRGRRGSGPVRRVVECHVRVLDADTALVVSVNAPASGGRGVVTQLWRRESGSGSQGARPWRIASAQVQASPPAIDRRVWRVVGEPLVSGRRDDGVTGSAPPPGSRALAGETVAVKDLFAVAGHTIGAGVPARLAGATPETGHAAAVQHLLDAGADLRGIAQTDEFAYSIAGRNSAYGTPPNPAVPGAISGGSTSGPAAAVALGQASIGLGTDTGGSLRVPASYQGLWGLRTTHGAVDRTGLLPLAPSFDTVGWLTRDVDTLRRAAEASLPSADQVSVESSYVVDPALLSSVTPEVRAEFGRALDEATAAGRVPRPEQVLLGDVAQLFELFRVLQAFEAWQSDGDWITAHPGELAADVAARFAFGATISPRQAEEARVALGHERHRLESLLDGRVLLLPSASSAAPSLGASAAEVDAVRSATLGLTCVAGVLGAPAVSVPVLEVPLASGRRAPVGLCLVGPRGSDLSLLDLAATWAT
ncbi:MULTISPECIES: AtzH-like domain-containing protein [unclassified Frigoribacterium]|uniref:AtzH-like domain-containing protein n=1 Tax=unclassified Frigoribacterium TaxID=2627005 RepID=UPI000A9B7C3C|nr:MULTISPECIES: AtzH-like domain-containing protein [unclassified Frigoribacterium]